jgi:hypothetical protein
MPYRASSLVSAAAARAGLASSPPPAAGGGIGSGGCIGSSCSLIFLATVLVYSDVPYLVSRTYVSNILDTPWN